VALRLAWASGLAALMAQRRGGAGAILRFEQVRPARRDTFQPRRGHEITPEFLDRAIAAMKRWKLDFVSIDEACRRAAGPRTPRRFVCLTFQGATADFMAHASPVLVRHGVPFTLYVATAFPDGVGEAWWLALEQLIARNDRLALVMEGRDCRFEMPETDQKLQLYDVLARWLRTLPPAHLSAAIHDLCSRYGVDLASLSRQAFMNWNDLASVAADPLATFGSATVNYPVLQNLDDAAALREMSMGRAVAEAALHREVSHFAYPFGDRASFGDRHVMLAKQAGFASAVTAVPGVVQYGGASNHHALPRIPWDSRIRSLAALRAILSGIGV
jgi:peptidoglycan/xylan/chitin deacetylase (PgdA/CDA1 family)